MVAQKFSMYRAVPKRKAMARIAGHTDRQGATKILSPEETKSKYAIPEKSEVRHETKPAPIV